MLSNGIDKLTEVLRQRLDYFRRIYGLTYAETIGVLRIVTQEVEDERLEVEGEAEQEGEPDGG